MVRGRALKGLKNGVEKSSDGLQLIVEDTNTNERVTLTSSSSLPGSSQWGG